MIEMGKWFHEAIFLGGCMTIYLLDETKVQMSVVQCSLVEPGPYTIRHAVSKC